MSELGQENLSAIIQKPRKRYVEETGKVNQTCNNSCSMSWKEKVKRRENKKKKRRKKSYHHLSRICLKREDFMIGV